MFLWAAGDFDRQGIRLAASAVEHYPWNGTIDVSADERSCVHVIMCVCARTHTIAGMSANISWLSGCE